MDIGPLGTKNPKKDGIATENNCEKFSDHLGKNIRNDNISNNHTQIDKVKMSAIFLLSKSIMLFNISCILVDSLRRMELNLSKFSLYINFL